MIPLLLSLLLACNPRDDGDCVVYRDKCSSGCAYLCGSTREASQASKQVCDLGCMDSGYTPSDAECVLVDDSTCGWAE